MKRYLFYLKSDLARDRNISLKVKYQLVVFRLGFYGHHCLRNRIAKIAIMSIYNVLKVSCYIIGINELPYYPVYVGEGLKIPHGFSSTVLSQYAKIGKNATIYHNVTIGVIENRNYKYGDILIGNDIYIGCGATILGKCKIGNNVTIGANSLLINQDIPDNSIVFAPKAVFKPKY